MTFEVLDIESGDVLASYDSLDVAQERLHQHLDEHPEERDDLVIAEVGDDGVVEKTTAPEFAF